MGEELRTHRVRVVYVGQKTVQMVSLRDLLMCVYWREEFDRIDFRPEVGIVFDLTMRVTGPAGPTPIGVMVTPADVVGVSNVVRGETDE